MPARPYWKGYMRLSLVTFPVQLYTAIETNEKVTLHQIHKPTGERIRYQKIVPDLGPVPTDEIVKGYEYEKNQYVLLEDEELEALKLESKHTIDLVQFVDQDEIDEIYFERPYYVVPESGIGEEAFRVVRDALRRAKKVALGQIVMANRERITAIRPCSRGMILETLRYGSEVRKISDYFGKIEGGAEDQDQVELAEAIIQKRSKPFDPDAFKDHYQTALRELVQAKLKGMPLERGVEPERGKVIDLTEALRRSLGQIGASKGEPPPGEARKATATRGTSPKAAAKGGKGKAGPGGGAAAKKDAEETKPSAGGAKPATAKKRSRAA